MGLDISIIQTEPGLDLGRLYAVRNAIEDSFDWTICAEYPVEKLKKYIRKCEDARNLSKFAIIGSTEDESTRKFLVTIPDLEFATCVKHVVDSIGEFDERNSHVFFEWDRLPGNDIYDSCSWSMKRMLGECARVGATIPKCLGDTLVELDPRRVRVLARKWKKAAWKLTLAKWVGFFSQDAGDRMVDDVCRDLGEDSLANEMEARDLIYVKDALVGICRKLRKGHRLWMTVSY